MHRAVHGLLSTSRASAVGLVSNWYRYSSCVITVNVIGFCALNERGFVKSLSDHRANDWPESALICTVWNCAVWEVPCVHQSVQGAVQGSVSTVSVRPVGWVSKMNRYC